MYGGPSHIDTFDYKPEMIGMDGKTVDVKTFGRGGKKNEGRIVEPRWKFKQHGQCGKYVSELFPHVANASMTSPSSTPCKPTPPSTAPPCS